MLQTTHGVASEVQAVARIPYKKMAFGRDAENLAVAALTPFYLHHSTEPVALHK